MKPLPFALFFTLVLQCTSAANILGLFYLPSRSHHILGETLMRGFAKAGHNVTLMSTFPVKNPPENFTHIHLSEMVKPFEEIQNDIQKGTMWTMFQNIKKFQKFLTEIPLNSDGMKKLRSSGVKYDIIINEDFVSRVLFGLAHELGAQMIPFCPSHASFLPHPTGNAAPYSFIPNMLLSFTDHMTFIERVINTVIGVASTLLKILIIEPVEKEYYKKYFENGPDLDELSKNVPLLLINSHISLEYPRPYVPSMIQIGGYHVQERPTELPKDLKDYMDSAKEGFIYCSLGSNVKPSAMSKNKILAFTRSFAKFPYKVLWKWDAEEVPEISSNVKTQKWFPQNDILAHPNLKVFITHGGMLSTTEAIVNGVPMIGIPFFADQTINVKTVTSGGFGIAVLQDDLTTETLTAAILEITENPKYRQEVQKRQAVFLDRPMKPMDTAVYWVEHILRHGGGHLRCAGANLNFFQYYLIDVIAFLFAVIFLVIKIIIYSCKFCCYKRRAITKSKKE